MKLPKKIIKALSIPNPRKNIVIAENCTVVLALARKVTFVASDRECCAASSLNALTQNSLANNKSYMPPIK